MPFPDEPLDLTCELHVNGQWQDITADCRTREDIVITRGRRDWSGRVDPSRCTLQINNDGGRYSPRNPASDLYGLIGRNTPLRVRLGPSQAGVRLDGRPATFVSTPDATALDITADLDVRIEVTPASWRPDTADWEMLAAKHDYIGDHQSWSLILFADGRLELAWSPDGTTAARRGRASTVPVPASPRRLAVRATLDVDNGADGHTVRFYTAPTLAGPWSPLGDPVTAGGVTSVHAGTADLTLGADHRGYGMYTQGTRLRGLLHRFELRDGIDGPAVAAVDFTGVEPGQAGIDVTDASGRVWTLRGHAITADPSIRFAGEVSSWPQRWDVTGHDKWVPIQAAGIGRRLGQGTSPLRSAMYRGSTNESTASRTVAYWPLEDGRHATVFASAMGGAPMQIAARPVLSPSDLRRAAYDGFASSEALPEFFTTWAVGTVPTAPDTGELRVFALVHVPDDGVPATCQLMSVGTSGTAAEWSITVEPTGRLHLEVTDRTGTTLLDAELLGSAVNGKPMLAGLWLQQQGSDIKYQAFVYDQDSPVGAVYGATLPGRTFGHATSVILGGAGDLAGTAFGHVSVQNRDTDNFGAILWRAYRAHLGEPAAERIMRLCAEEGVPVTVPDGDPADTEPLGAQGVGTLQALLAEAADADLGILYEPRDMLGLRYRPRHTLYNQLALELDYGAGHIAPPFEPEDDDQTVRNDWTVNREGGASARAVLESGPLSVQPPPDGVGRYDTTKTLSLASDTQLRSQAGWRRHLSTVDEPRYPAITVDLARNPGLLDAVLAVDVGDRIQVVGTPPHHQPGVVDQIVQGCVERLNEYRALVSWNCSPARPWTVGVFDDPVRGKAGTGGAQLVADIDADDPAPLVLTTVGPRWTTNPAQLPLEVTAGGETWDVTAIGSAVLDTFTRTVSGGWGTADTGQTWSVDVPADYSVDGARGLITISTTGVARVALLAGFATTDIDVVTTLSVDKVAVGNWLVGWVLALRGGGYYAARAEFRNTGRAVVAIYNDAGAVLSEYDVGTYSAGQEHRLRFAIAGTQLRAKLWPATAAEPSLWQVHATIDGVTSPGGLGIRVDVPGGITSPLPVTFAFADLEVLNPQTFTVARGVNGIRKSHAAGTPVSLAHPAVLAP